MLGHGPRVFTRPIGRAVAQRGAHHTHLGIALGKRCYVAAQLRGDVVFATHVLSRRPAASCAEGLWGRSCIARTTEPSRSLPPPRRSPYLTPKYRWDAKAALFLIAITLAPQRVIPRAAMQLGGQGVVKERCGLRLEQSHHVRHGTVDWRIAWIPDELDVPIQVQDIAAARHVVE